MLKMPGERTSSPERRESRDLLEQEEPEDEVVKLKSSVMRGIGNNGPQGHYSWAKWAKEQRSYDLKGRDHSEKPLCRVPGKRKFKIVEDFDDVTCRGCLRAIALGIRGEDSWRNQIIKCAKGSERPRCSEGTHSIRANRCDDCGVEVHPA